MMSAATQPLMATFKYVFAGTTYVFTGGEFSTTFEFTGLPHIPKFNLEVGDYEVSDSRVVKDQGITSLPKQEQSPLLRLPGELRNQIYVYAIGDRNDIWVGQSGNKLIFSKQQGWSTTWIEQVTLQATCRQISRETADMHFVLNTFCGYLRPLMAFLSHPNTPKDKITSICLSLHNNNSSWQTVRRETECDAFRATVKALPNLREASILFGFYDEQDKQKIPLSRTATELKNLLGFDSDRLVFSIRYRHWDEQPPMDYVSYRSSDTSMSFADTVRSLHVAVRTVNRAVRRRLYAETRARRLMDGLGSTFDQMQL
ncbi:hypothetical protein E8E13_006820 [Curvularia kusanoi]|uniref:Uncharacterized protein n=1 Tax=Curvularia kusanoi TaxID=90978 RepID=A0A9P4W7W4_CURKU|nr:hypothetical protein E8E13_006820 [Curvularia kusanoi]